MSNEMTVEYGDRWKRKTDNWGIKIEEININATVRIRPAISLAASGRTRSKWIPIAELLTNYTLERRAGV